MKTPPPPPTIDVCGLFGTDVLKSGRKLLERVGDGYAEHTYWRCRQARRNHPVIEFEERPPDAEVWRVGGRIIGPVRK